MVYTDSENIVFSTAVDFISNSNQPVFLTGKAGTGKTTFLKFIKEKSNKNIVIVAPTGVAAINAGGTTIHSFFQLPFTPFVPVNKQWGQTGSMDKHNLLSKLRLNAERKEIMQQLELLIIDEVSMVRCDVLDAIDTVLKHVRNQHNKAFGGVQVLYIGDLYQLPPVIKADEWKLLSPCYENPYFFSSQVINAQPPVYIELQKVYRQADLSFINLLNKVRNNEMDEADHEFLHSRYLPGFTPKKDENYITLTTHNNKADEINREALASLEGTPYSFKAMVEGDFYEKSFPADEFLNIKPGAQVMFLKNDLEKVRRYYNGKIAIVDRVEEDKIWVRCNTGDTEQVIEVKKETWRNIQYTLNSKTQHVDEQELGSFTQYPLRLAWAITIHKSQGLTFEKAIIDAGSAFAPGQVYVALSRCTCLEGIVLHSKISSNSLHSDDRIVRFCSNQKLKFDQSDLLFNAKMNYQQETIQGLFDFTHINNALGELLQVITENNVLGKSVFNWLATIQQQLVVHTSHGSKFINVLGSLFTENELPEENTLIQQRLIKAADWFIAEFTKLKNNFLLSPAVTDNRQLANDYNTKLQKLWDITCLQIHLLEGLQNGFSIENYRQHKSIFKTSPFTLSAYSGKSGYVPVNIAHPELYNALKDKREEICREKNLPLFMVCGTLSLEQMANFLPLTLPALDKISGFGKIKLKQFGNDFIQIIQNYCQLHDLDSRMDLIPVKTTKKQQTKKIKSDTKKLSFDLYQEGKSILDIAASRNLSVSTIEGHLSHFIETGELDIDTLVEKEKQVTIKVMLKETGDPTLQKLKEKLPGVSYGELKWVLASTKNATASA